VTDFTNDDPSKTAGMLGRLKVFIDCKVFVVYNMDVSDLLANGTPGVVKSFSKDINKIVTTIWIDFIQPKVGAALRLRFKSYEKLSSPNHTPMTRSDLTWTEGEGKDVSRLQFPLRPCGGMTIHKSQGLTLHQGVVNVGKRFDDNMAYVALSRFTDPKRLRIKTKIRTDPAGKPIPAGDVNYDEITHEQLPSKTRGIQRGHITACEFVKREMARLREDANSIELAPVSIHALPKVSGAHCTILYHNVQSIRNCMEDIRNCQTYKHPDIVLLAETHLSTSNFNASLNIEGYTNHRFDNNKHTGGVLLYTKHDMYGIADHAVEGLDIIVYTYPINNKWETICFLYRNPSIKINIFMSSIKDIIRSYGNDVIFIGDFNYKRNGLPISLKRIFDAHAFKQIVHGPTHTSGNTIDHVYLSNTNRASTHVLQSYFSDHYPIHIQLMASPQGSFCNDEANPHGGSVEIFQRKPPCK
jgi:hypothetical protein